MECGPLKTRSTRDVFNVHGVLTSENTFYKRVL